MATVVEALESRFGDEVEAADEIFSDPELIRLLGRRTCREYGPAQVSSDLVDALLRVAFSASSKSDYQQASVIKVEDPGRRADLAALVPSMPWIGRSPGVSRVLRRRPAACAHLLAAGSPAVEREPGGLLQRLCRRCPRDADVHRGCRAGRLEVLPDQCHSQPSVQSGADPVPAFGRHSRCRPLRRLSGRARSCQHEASARRNNPY